MKMNAKMSGIIFLFVCLLIALFIGQWFHLGGSSMGRGRGREGYSGFPFNYSGFPVNQGINRGFTRKPQHQMVNRKPIKHATTRRAQQNSITQRPVNRGITLRK